MSYKRDQHLFALINLVTVGYILIIANFAHAQTMVSKLPVDITISLQSPVYHTSHTDQGQVNVTIMNRGTHVVEVPTLGSWGEGFALHVQTLSGGEYQGHPLHLMTCQSCSPQELGWMKIPPGVKRSIFHAKMSDLLPVGPSSQ